VIKRVLVLVHKKFKKFTGAQSQHTGQCKHLCRQMLQTVADISRIYFYGFGLNLHFSFRCLLIKWWHLRTSLGHCFWWPGRGQTLKVAAKEVLYKRVVRGHQSDQTCHFTLAVINEDKCELPVWCIECYSQTCDERGECCYVCFKARLSCQSLLNVWCRINTKHFQVGSTQMWRRFRHRHLFRSRKFLMMIQKLGLVPLVKPFWKLLV